jgi:transcriptional regulator with XRE-family HTH domain
MESKAKKPLKPDIRDVVGGHIKRLRHEANITQDDLAQRCGIYRTYLSRAENGDANLTITALETLAKSLKVDIREFFGKDD